MKINKISFFLSFFLVTLLFSCFKEDTTSPIITLKGRSIITIPVGREYHDPGFSAKDNRDGDIAYLVKESGIPPTDSAGIFVISYHVTDASGNDAKEVTRKVIITHDNTTITGIYEAEGACNSMVIDNLNYFITAEKDPADLKTILLSGLNKLPKEYGIKTLILGSTGQEILIPEQVVKDTVYYGKGVIDPRGKEIALTIIKTFSTGYRDTCHTLLVKYTQ